jgi:hypothetical protein
MSEAVLFNNAGSLNVVVASSDAEIYSVVQGDMKTTNRLCQKKCSVLYGPGI